MPGEGGKQEGRFATSGAKQDDEPYRVYGGACLRGVHSIAFVEICVCYRLVWIGLAHSSVELASCVRLMAGRKGEGGKEGGGRVGGRTHTSHEKEHTQTNTARTRQKPFTCENEQVSTSRKTCQHAGESDPGPGLILVIIQGGFRGWGNRKNRTVQYSGTSMLQSMLLRPEFSWAVVTGVCESPWRLRLNGAAKVTHTIDSSKLHNGEGVMAVSRLHGGVGARSVRTFQVCSTRKHPWGPSPYGFMPPKRPRTFTAQATACYSKTIAGLMTDSSRTRASCAPENNHGARHFDFLVTKVTCSRFEETEAQMSFLPACPGDQVCATSLRLLVLHCSSRDSFAMSLKTVKSQFAHTYHSYGSAFLWTLLSLVCTRRCRYVIHSIDSLS
jgi:hypothetical protein